MSTLERIQSDFQHYILGKDGAYDAVAVHVCDRGGLGLDERFAIYLDAYRKRMHQSMAAAFRTTRSYVGDRRFRELVDGYVVAHPSRHSNLRWLGDKFAAFVWQTLPDSPIVEELAALEWALGLAYDAPDAVSICAADLAHLPPSAWAGFVCALHPAVHRLTLTTNAVAIWQALTDGRPPPAGVHMAPPQAWLVWRLDHQPRLRALDQAEAAALDGMAKGASFGAVCDPASAGGKAAAEEGAALALRMAACLQSWLAHGLLTPVPVST